MSGSPFADASLTLGVAMTMTVMTGLAIAGSFRWLLADHNMATVARSIRQATAQLLDVFAAIEAQCSGLLFPEIQTLRQVVQRELLRAKRAGHQASLALQNPAAPTAGTGEDSVPNSAVNSTSGSKTVSPTKPAGSSSLPPLVPSLSLHSLAWPTTAASAAVASAAAADGQRNRRATPSPTREAAKRASLGRSKPAKSKLGGGNGNGSGLNKAGHVKARPSTASASSFDTASVSNLSLADSDSLGGASPAGNADDTHSLADSTLTGYADDVADSPGSAPILPTITTLRNARFTLSPPSHLKLDPDTHRRPKLPQITTATLERHLRSLEDRLTRALEKVDGVRASEEGLREALLQSAPLKALTSDAPNGSASSKDTLSRSHTADLELASHPKIAAQISETVELVRLKKSSLTKTIHRGLDIVDSLIDLICDPSAANVLVVLPPGKEKLGECIEIGQNIEIPSDLLEPVAVAEDKDGSAAAGSESEAQFFETIAKLLDRLPEVETGLFEQLQSAHEEAFRIANKPPSPEPLEGTPIPDGQTNGTGSGSPTTEKPSPVSPFALPQWDFWKLASSPSEVWKLTPTAGEAWTAVQGVANDVASKVTEVVGKAKESWEARSVAAAASSSSSTNSAGDGKEDKQE